MYDLDPATFNSPAVDVPLDVAEIVPEGPVVAALEAAGWRAGLPHQLLEALAIDTEAIAGMVCFGCNHVGMEALAFRKGPAYACVAECPQCGWQEEF